VSRRARVDATIESTAQNGKSVARYESTIVDDEGKKNICRVSGCEEKI
jgi:hypothetical protein